MNPQQPKQGSPGLVSGLVGTAKNMFALVISRIELAALEFSEIGTHLLRLMFASALSIVALWFALAFWCALVVVLAWDALGWKILLILAALFTILAVGCALYVRSVLRQGRLGLPVTMAELRKDRDAIL
ncbi:hypothetical protein CAter282_4533 [Collimonas arenae]|uniref:Membrane protein YqjE n=1 Tax=Collimonas arenae TaxID=279058 RepID=A0A127PX14_9BURK|nr:phage holin family protein [Collimonas arenae]AMP02296.1 hypothetical protein CAter10_4933 [Collimonas arenae]AMP12191.1 hypothetical protein CAter282_4533 [Collimonas arenae]